MKNNINYYLGLDMGTNSVGWAATDENYNLIRFKGKDLWGIREFDEAETKAGRRTNRTARRRRQREVARIGLVKDYFYDALTEVDPNFLPRLENSKYYKEDKDPQLNSKYALFNDKNYKDSDYYKEYPTVFHLRRELINNTKPHDVRLVYLAIINMFKHRGHFLHSGDLNNDNPSNLYASLTTTLSEVLNIQFTSQLSDDEVLKVLSNTDTSKTRKKEVLIQSFNIDKKEKAKIELIKMICGLKANGKIIFENTGIAFNDDSETDIDVSSFAFDEKIVALQDTFGDENFEVIAATKALYDSILLSKTLSGFDYISESRCASYDKHKEDLKILKAVYREHLDLDAYNKMFRLNEPNSYSAYVNTTNSTELEKNGNLDNKTKLRRNFDKKRKSEDLYKTIKKDLENVPDTDKNKAYILREIEKEAFLPKQLTAANGVIPNQVHKKELIKILSNAEKYLPFLLDKDDFGLTVSERIVELFSFQIPYYVGPLGKNSKTGWVVRKEGRVLPWNLDQIVDLKETSVRFIERMVRRCTYITSEDVHALPKGSLLYETYCVLNEINNIKINGINIMPHQKQELFNQLYLNQKRVTRKQINQFFINKGLAESEDEISGMDIQVNNQMTTYHKFKSILGDKIKEDDYKKFVEDVVFWSTIFADKKKVKDSIEEKYSHLVDKDTIRKVSNLKFKDWGRLSKEFFYTKGFSKLTGEHASIIRMMWETNDNLSELLSENNYTFIEEIRKKQQVAVKSLSEFTYDDLENTYFSAPVKRMVWQTILIMKELEEALGCPPKLLFLEMTRNKMDKPDRTKSREIKFLELYKSVKDDKKNWKEIIEDSSKNGKLKTKKMYLYLTQKGRCMYTGEEIDLNQLFTTAYDIDHIYPRHYVKDDNIENNLVLVKKEINNEKSDSYPINKAIKQKCRGMWKCLLDKNFISKEKYDRLTSNNELTLDQKANFIARQLVETSQGTKGVADILKTILPKETTIVYSKASNVSDFRRHYDIPKSRILNDLHHAHDAYLNIVVGNVYFAKFTQNPRIYLEKDFDSVKNNYNLSKMYEWNVVREGKTAWVASKNNNPGTIAVVKKTLSKNTPLMTRMSFEKGGQLTEATIVSHHETKVEGYMPLKTTDPKMQDVTRYGGKTNISASYFCLVEHQKKKKIVRTIESVPVYLKDKIKHDGIDVLVRYLEDVLKLEKPKVLITKIPIQSLVKKDGYYLHITGKTGNRLVNKNAVNLILNNKWVEYIHKIEKYMDKKGLDELLCIEKNIELYDILTKKHNDTIYAKRPNPVGKKLINRRNKFIELPLEKQVEMLFEILHLTEIGVRAANLKLIGESPNTGKMLINKEISSCKEFMLIHQSVTGIYERKVDLLSDDLENGSHI